VVGSLQVETGTTGPDRAESPSAQDDNLSYGELEATLDEGMRQSQDHLRAHEAEVHGLQRQLAEAEVWKSGPCRLQCCVEGRQESSEGMGGARRCCLDHRIGRTHVSRQLTSVWWVDRPRTWQGRVNQLESDLAAERARGCAGGEGAVVARGQRPRERPRASGTDTLTMDVEDVMGPAPRDSPPRHATDSQVHYFGSSDDLSEGGAGLCCCSGQDTSVAVSRSLAVASRLLVRSSPVFHTLRDLF
jgi:hypothetical protein